MAAEGTLSLNEAAKKYGIPQRTLSKWRADGILRTFSEADRRGQAVLVFERDVAAAKVHYVPGPGRGKRALLKAAIAAG